MRMILANEVKNLTLYISTIIITCKTTVAAIHKYMVNKQSPNCCVAMVNKKGHHWEMVHCCFDT